VAEINVDQLLGALEAAKEDHLVQGGAKVVVALPDGTSVALEGAQVMARGGKIVFDCS
jgi:hypothetical protein